jgi:hypothetical protein
LCYLADDNIDECQKYFNLAKSSFLQNDAYETYSTIQTAIVALALGEDEIAVKYIELAKKINRANKYPTDSYPYVNLIGNHERVFVDTIAGFDEPSSLQKDHVQQFRGHSHVIARHSLILYASDQALEALVRVSKNWHKPLEKKAVRQRLDLFKLKFCKVSWMAYSGGYPSAYPRAFNAVRRLPPCLPSWTFRPSCKKR